MSRRETALKYFDNMPSETKMRIETGIELNRKRNADITIKTSDGSKLPENITVKLEQKNHEFRFGANIFMLDEFESEEKNVIYRQKFPELFNLATVPFYWSTLEPERGKPRFAVDSPKIYRRPATDLCVNYCKEKGIEPKCHCLNYDCFIPEWLKKDTVPEIKKALYKRFSEIAERYSADIPGFEVTNETLQNCYSAFFYEDDFLEWSYRTADRLFPNNKLIINDYNYWWPNLTNRNAYYMQIERLISNGITHLDSIGLQFHSFFPLSSEPGEASKRYNPDTLLKVMDLFGRFGKTEQITEMTIPAYSADGEDEDIQAEILKNVYTVFFSHPAMEAVIYWNLVDGYAWSAEPGDMNVGENVYRGGLLRFDMSEKPAFTGLKKLINEDWHTSLEVKADGGHCGFRGFCGDYEATVYAGEKAIPVSFKVSKDSLNYITLVI